MILLALAVIRFPPKRIARTVRLLLETITRVADDSIYSINGNILIFQPRRNASEGQDSRYLVRVSCEFE
jgi:hypothetical protein